MRTANIIGLILLIIVLAGVFFGLYTASTSVGQAVKFAESEGNIIECSIDNDCPNNQKCLENFCRFIKAS